MSDKKTLEKISMAKHCLMANDHMSVGDLSKEERDNIQNVQNQNTLMSDEYKQGITLYLRNYFDDLIHPSKGVPFKRTEPKIGRNAPCPCGSSRKYKNCCLNKKQ